MAAEMICVLEFIGAVAAMIAGFIIWALLIEWRTNSGMRAFSARWAKLSAEQQKQETYKHYGLGEWPPKP